MAVYTYRAIDAQSSVTEGVIWGDTPKEARDRLRQRGLTVEEILSSQEKATSTPIWRRWLACRHRLQVVSVMRELATMSAVGIGLLEALETIAQQYRGSFRAALLLLRDQVSAGASLSEAMRQQPELFDEIYVQMVHVGENSGNLETVLQDVAEFKQRSLEFRSHVATALTYPVMVLGMAIAVSIFLMTFVVPALLTSLVETGKDLPFATRVVKGFSDLLVQYWWLLSLAAGGLGFLGNLALNTEKGRLWWHRHQLRIPYVGDMILKQSIARITLVVSALMRSGIVFLKALEIAQKMTYNRVLQEGLLQCASAVGRGEEISTALEETRVFPPLVIQVFALGQKSGQLEEMLERLSEHYDRQTSLAARRLTVVLEPVMIVLVASFVGFIALATILPVLEASNVL